MSIVTFVNDMLSLGTIPAYISLGCIGVFLLFVIWHTFRGFKRGVFKQLIHIAFVGVSIAAAFYIASFLWTRSLNILDEYTFENLLGMVGISLPEGTLNTLNLFDPYVIEYILMLPLGVIVMPAVFMVLFFFINIVLKFFYALFVIIFRIGNGERALTKILGLVLGALEGALVASVILLPIASVADIAEDAYEMITETNEERGTEETVAEKVFIEYLDPFAQNPVLGLIDKFGSDLLLDKLASVEDGGIVLNMRDECASVIRFAFVDIPALKDTDWMNLSEQDKVVVSDVVDFVAGSPYKATIVSEILGYMSDVVKADTMGDGAADVISAIFDIFDDIDRDELPGVLHVFEDFYFLVSDEGILGGFSSGDRSTLTKAFTEKDENGNTTLSKMTAILESNERTAILVSTFTKMTITVLSDSMGLDQDAITKYNDMKSSVSGALKAIDTTKPEEEQVADMSAALAEAFASNGMNVESGAIDNMAKGIIENYADVENISDSDFDAIMLSYYQANMDSLGDLLQ